jgi:hypothetical protein
MIRSIVIGLAIQCVSTSATIADDYLLRLESIGYVDAPSTEDSPKETVFRSIEIVARSESTFYGKVKTGRQTLQLAGELRAAERDTFRVNIHYIHATDTGRITLTDDGKQTPVLDTSSLRTTVVISLGKPLSLGGLEGSTVTQGAKAKHTKSKIRHVLVLTQHNPLTELKRQANNRFNPSGGPRRSCNPHQLPPPG